MSSVNKIREQRLYKDTKVTKDLIKRNPKILEHFCDWYLAHAKDHASLHEDIDGFFNMSFEWVISIWYDYFYYCGIDISIGENKVYVYYNTIGDVYNHLSDRKEIFYITSDDKPSARFEEAVAELICRIQLPF